MLVKKNFRELNIDKKNNRYTINNSVKFPKENVIRYIREEYVLKSLDFAYNMSKNNNHRKYRSGGDIKRKQFSVFFDTFIGKLGENAVYQYFSNHHIESSTVDYQEMPLGEWDITDLKVKNSTNQKYNIAIKTTKFFGNLLLLEEKDWTNTGEYIPNINSGKYDFIVFSRIKLDIKKFKHLVSTFYKAEKEEFIHTFIKELEHESGGVQYDIPGFVTNNDLVTIIESRHLIPQGSYLSKYTKMDATNYYVQTGDMRNIDDIKNYF